jgi:hypothetical protein
VEIDPSVGCTAGRSQVRLPLVAAETRWPHGVADVRERLVE